VFQRIIVDLKYHVNLPLVKDRFAEVTPCPDNPCQMHLDAESERLLGILINEVLPAFVATDKIISRSVLWRHDDGVSDRLHPEYLNEMCQTIRCLMMSMIDEAACKLADTDQQDDDEDGLDLEVDQHCTWAKVSVDGFQGQEEALELIHSYVISTELKPLIVYGDTGVGKTSLMAKAALEVTYYRTQSS